jgi:hypothetical protein
MVVSQTPLPSHLSHKDEQVASGSYRVDFLDRRERVTRRIEIECQDDAQAVAVVAECAQNACFAMELRQRDRLVMRFEPNDGF